MSTLSILPLTYDMDYITEKLKAAAVTNHFGFSEIDGAYHLVYRADDYDKVQAVLDAYNIEYADEFLRSHLLAKVAEIRWQKSQFIMRDRDGVMTPTWALGAILNLTAKLSAMHTRVARGEADVTTVWKFGDGWHETLTVDELEDHGLAIDAYVQACFNHEGLLSYQIKTAADVDALNAIDITTGWPE